MLFYYCTNLEYLDISGMDIYPTSSGDWMIRYTPNLKTIIAPKTIARSDIELPGIFALDDDGNNIPDNGERYSFFPTANRSHRYIMVQRVGDDEQSDDSNNSDNTAGNDNQSNDSNTNNNSSNNGSQDNTENTASENQVTSDTGTFGESVADDSAGDVSEIIDAAQNTTTVKALKAGKKLIIVSWKKQANGIKGYEIQYSTDKKFKTNTKSILIKNSKATTKVIKKLKARKKYYVRIRTYKMLGAKKVYSNWSKSKKVKTT